MGMTGKEIQISEEWGTPCKYKEKYSSMLKKHLSQGYSLGSFAAKIDVTYPTLTNWAKRFPEFAHAREIGEAARLRMLEWEGIKMIKDGNVTAWKFMMNQMGISETTEVMHNHNHTGTIEVSPQNRGNAPARFARLQKLKELNRRVSLEDPKTVEAEIVEDLDFLQD